MYLDQETHSGNGVTPLVAGIVRDAQTLISQQLALFQCEIKKDLGKTKEAAISLSLGVAVLHLAGIFLLFAVAHLVVWLWPVIPIFAAYAVLGVILVVAGWGLIAAGRSQIDDLAGLAAKSVEDIKENVQWTTKN